VLLLFALYYFLGLAGSIIVTVSYLPQTLKTIRTKSTRDLSLSWLGALTVGLVLYTSYGISISSAPVVLSSGVGGALVIVLLAYKIKYG
jgi:MtN3 and saliva related transmembrane protein